MQNNLSTATLVALHTIEIELRQLRDQISLVVTALDALNGTPESLGEERVAQIRDYSQRV